MITLQAEEFLDWKQNETTVTFFKALRNAREVWKEELIRGNIENEEFVKGKAQAFLDLTVMTYEDMMEILHDKY